MNYMALTRKLLESLGIESDKVSTIIDAHAETVDALKGQIETFKADAEKLKAVEKELATANTELESLKATGGDWQKKYEKEHSDFEAFKTEQSAKETKSAKESAYRELLKKAGVSDKRFDSILKVTDLSKSELKDGKFNDEDKLIEGIKTEWSDFVTNTTVSGAKTITPPANAIQRKYTQQEISQMSRDEINKNWDAISASLKN